MMKTNGLSDGNGCKAGQKIVIPTYVYNSKAPVSAPDSNPKVADAKSSHGNKSDVPAGKLPAPLEGRRTRSRCCRKSPKLKEGETQPPTEATSANERPKPAAAKAAATRSRRRHAVAGSPGRTASASSR